MGASSFTVEVEMKSFHSQLRPSIIFSWAEQEPIFITKKNLFRKKSFHKYRSRIEQFLDRRNWTVTGVCPEGRKFLLLSKNGTQLVRDGIH